MKRCQRAVPSMTLGLFSTGSAQPVGIDIRKRQQRKKRWLITMPTGELKIFPYTQRMLAFCDLSQTWEGYQESVFSKFEGRKWYTSEPFYSVS